MCHRAPWRGGHRLGHHVRARRARHRAAVLRRATADSLAHQPRRVLRDLPRDPLLDDRGGHAADRRRSGPGPVLPGDHGIGDVLSTHVVFPGCRGARRRGMAGRLRVERGGPGRLRLGAGGLPVTGHRLDDPLGNGGLRGGGEDGLRAAQRRAGRAGVPARARSRQPRTRRTRAAADPLESRAAPAAGESRFARRRYCPRLQQPADGDPRSRVAAARKPRVRRQRGRRRDHRARGPPGRRAVRAPPRLRRGAADRSATDRSQRARPASSIGWSPGRCRRTSTWSCG